MKEKLTVVLSAVLLIFSCVFISCQEDFYATNTSTVRVPNSLLNAAKEWHSQTTQGSNNNQLSNTSKNVLLPIWKDAALNKLKNGITEIVVPGIELPVSVRSKVGVVRKFVFDQQSGRITGGRIIEIYADARYIAEHKKNLLENYENGDLNGFTGSVIAYDVNYHYLISFSYKNGDLISGTSRIRQLPSDKKYGTSSPK